jgi:GTP-binding protein
VQNDRPTSKTRRQEYLERMDGKAAARAELVREREAGMWNDDEGFAVTEKAGVSTEDSATDA